MPVWKKEKQNLERWENIFKNSLKTGCHVLDDGCGAGFFTTLLASMGFQVTAVDYSTKMLEEVRRRISIIWRQKDLKQNFIRWMCKA